MPKKLETALVFLFGLLPAFLFGFKAFSGGLSANPIDDLTDQTGEWTLRFLLLTLTITPLRKIFGWNRIIRHRRTLGLFAFFYGSLHFLTYVWLDQFFDFPEILSDMANRRFIAVGFVSFFIMIPLAVTSTKKMIQKLGKNWPKLHRLVYLAALGGVIHFYWLVKADTREPFVYGGILAVLMLLRLRWVLKYGQVLRKN